MKLIITHSAEWKENQLCSDGETILQEDPGTDFSTAIRSAYQQVGKGYRKFYKMDDLSRSAFILSEVLMDKAALPERYPKDRIGVVLANSAASLDTDRIHQRSVEDPEREAPSPAVFVYTLPNISIGEMCIRHGITGENAFFIFEGFDPDPLTSYIEDLIGSGKCDACISGWIEKDGEDQHAFLYTVEKENEGSHRAIEAHDEERIRALFT